jgi:hypothetical protein
VVGWIRYLSIMKVGQIKNIGRKWVKTVEKGFKVGYIKDLSINK